MALLLIAGGYEYLYSWDGKSKPRLVPYYDAQASGSVFEMETRYAAAGDQEYSLVGKPVESWQRDTSHEYLLSRNGLWKADAVPTVREYNLTIREEDAWPAGVLKRMTLINGKFPGPVIEANAGDRIVVHYRNEASVPTTLHFHGLLQNGTNHMDGADGITQCGIPPGGEFTYNFTTSPDEWGTYFYHSHFSTQFLEGVVGPLVLHSPTEDALIEKGGLTYDEDIVLFVSELYFNNTYDLIQSYLAPRVENKEPIPDTGLMQGAAWFACSTVEGEYECVSDGEGAVLPVHPDKKYRMRVINGGGFSEFDFSIDGHVLTVIEADGTNVEPFDLEVVRMANGQRYSFLLDTSKRDSDADTFWIRGSMNPYCYDGENPHLDLELRAVLAYPDATREIIANNGKVPESLMPTSAKSRQLDGSVSCIDLNHTMLVPSIPQAAPEPDRFIHIDATFQIHEHQISKAYFNDTTWKQLNTTSTLNLVHNTSVNTILADTDSIHPAWEPNGNLVMTIDKPTVIDLLLNNFDDGYAFFFCFVVLFWLSFLLYATKLTSELIHSTSMDTNSGCLAAAKDTSSRACTNGSTPQTQFDAIRSKWTSLAGC